MSSQSPFILRQKIIAFLEFVSSKAGQEICGAFIALDQLPGELCRLWFDELYLLSKRYFDCLKGDVSEEQEQAFQALFLQEELQGLETFHHFLELRLNALERSDEERKITFASDFWTHTQKDACLALDYFEVDNKALREREQFMVELLRDRLIISVHRNEKLPMVGD